MYYTLKFEKSNDLQCALLAEFHGPAAFLRYFLSFHVDIALRGKRKSFNLK